jgi:hypothetical protein
LENDGVVTIWAAGKAGWYIIEPARAYSDVYSDMEDGVRAVYFLKDNDNLLTKSPAAVFAAYGKSQQISVIEAESKFLRHAQFILVEMEKAGRSDWAKGPIHQYLRRHIGAREDQSPAALVHPPVSEPTRAPPTKPRTRQLKLHASTVQTPKPFNPNKSLVDLKRRETDAAILWKLTARESERICPRPMSLEHLAHAVYVNFEFPDEKQAANYIRFQGQYLVKYMQERRQRKIWIDSPSTLYQELMTTELEPTMRTRMSKMNLRARDYELEDELVRDGVDRWESSDEEISTSHAQKGGLRPKSAGKRGKSYTAKQLESRHSAQESDDDNASSPMKRKNSLQDGTDAGSPRAHKRRELSTGQSSDASSQIEDALEQRSNITSVLPLRRKRDEDDYSDVLVVVKDTAFDPAANNEGDIWHCQSPDCTTKIYGASENLGRKLIEEHIETHCLDEEGKAPQMDVIIREMKKTNLPVA